MNNLLKLALFCILVIIVLNLFAGDGEETASKSGTESRITVAPPEPEPEEPEKPKLSAEEMAQRRKLYALTEVAPRYCPGIETGWFVRGSIRYPMSDDDFGLYKQAEDEWLEEFKKVGSRAVACEALMQVYGPGGKLELFQFE